MPRYVDASGKPLQLDQASLPEALAKKTAKTQFEWALDTFAETLVLPNGERIDPSLRGDALLTEIKNGNVLPISVWYQYKHAVELHQIKQEAEIKDTKPIKRGVLQALSFWAKHNPEAPRTPDSTLNISKYIKKESNQSTSSSYFFGAQHDSFASQNQINTNLLCSPPQDSDPDSDLSDTHDITLDLEMSTEQVWEEFIPGYKK